MSEHVTSWLGAYNDGELSGLRLRQVEAHLACCETCRAELEQLRALSTLLQESPAAENLTSADLFAAQVGLRLPRRPDQPAWKRALVTGWRLTPVGLFGAWAFVQAVFIVASLLLIALRVGLGGDAATTWLTASRPAAWQTAISGLLGAELSQVSQTTLRLLRTVGWGIALNLVPLIAVGLLYWAWLASWWASRRQHNGKLA